MHTPISTPEEVAKCAALVEKLRQIIFQCIAEGKKIVAMWDFDGVLGDLRDQLVWECIRDPANFIAYQGRVILQLIDDGPWAALARECGSLPGVTQYIVTARTGTGPTLRVMNWVGHHKVEVLQIFFTGRYKAGAYREIIEDNKRDGDTHFIIVDDDARNVNVFREVAEEMGMSDRANGILSPQINLLDENEVKKEMELVLAATEAQRIVVRPPTPPDDPGRTVLVTPNPQETICTMFNCV